MVWEIPREPVAAAFEVTASSVLLWAYSPEAQSARFIVERTRPEPDQDARVGKYPFELTEATGRTTTVDVGELQPDTPYRFKAQYGDGSATDWHYFRTSPLEDADAMVHFVWGADISNDPRFLSPALDTIANTGAQFYVSLGDWPYTDIPVRDEELAQYRASHRYARLLRPVRRLLAAMPMYAIYDDHEIRDNWDTGSFAEFPERHRAGLQAWDEFFPLRMPAGPPVRFRRVRRGRDVELFILDTRLYRSAYRDEDGPDKTMLGPVQLAWLKEGLSTSTATFKLVMCTVPLAFGSTNEHWNAYATERDALLAHIVDNKIPGVVFLTGDQHWFAAHRHANGIREYQVGPVMAFTRTPPEERAPEVIALEVLPNFGEVIVDEGIMTIMVRDQNGSLIYAETLTP